MKNRKITSFVLLIVMSAFLLTLCCCQHDDPNPVGKLSEDGNYVNVVLLYGQSNATGCSRHQYLAQTDPENVERYLQGFDNCQTAFVCEDSYTNGGFAPTRFGMGAGADFFGPEFGMADVLSTAFGNQKTYIIKWTFGGSNLAGQWLDGGGKRGKFYKKAIAFTKQMLQTLQSQQLNPRIIGVCWMQGESDTSDWDSAAYTSNESKFINYLRNDLVDYYFGTLNFVDAYISTRTIWHNPQAVNNAKQAVADNDSHVYCIKTNGEDETALSLFTNAEPTDNPDVAHYDSASMIALGREFAKQVLLLAGLQ